MGGTGTMQVKALVIYRDNPIYLPYIVSFQGVYCTTCTKKLSANGVSSHLYLMATAPFGCLGTLYKCAMTSVTGRGHWEFWNQCDTRPRTCNLSLDSKDASNFQPVGVGWWQTHAVCHTWECIPSRRICFQLFLYFLDPCNYYY